MAILPHLCRHPLSSAQHNPEPITSNTLSCISRTIKRATIHNSHTPLHTFVCRPDYLHLFLTIFTAPCRSKPSHNRRAPHPRNQFPHHLHHANLLTPRRRRYINRKSSTEMDSRRRIGRRSVLWLDHKGGGYAHADHDGLKNRKREVRRTQG